MKRKSKWLLPAAMTGVALVVAACAGTGGGGGSDGMSFFVSSTGSGKGADLGGLTGADAHCQKLASAAGSNGKTWRAYLSTQGKDGAQTVNARDRIGKGPWHNAKGAMIARDVDHLHGASNNVNKESALNEKGAIVSRAKGLTARNADPIFV